MKKLYHEFFCVPKDGKITDKVMITRIAATISVIVLCLVAMSFSAYAFFSHGVTSGTSVITSARFETMVSLTHIDESGNPVVNSPTGNYQNYMMSVEAGKTYTVTVTPTVDCTAKTGYVLITADGCDETYHTWQLWNEENLPEGENLSMTFDIMATADTNVYFVSNWGTSSYYDAYVNGGENSELYIVQGEAVTMVVDGITPPPAPIIEEVPPVTEEIVPPVTEEVPPVTEETPPVTEETLPVIEDTPITEETPPTTEEIIPPVTEELPEVTE